MIKICFKISFLTLLFCLNFSALASAENSSDSNKSSIEAKYKKVSSDYKQEVIIYCRKTTFPEGIKSWGEEAMGRLNSCLSKYGVRFDVQKSKNAYSKLYSDYDPEDRRFYAPDYDKMDEGAEEKYKAQFSSVMIEEMQKFYKKFGNNIDAFNPYVLTPKGKEIVSARYKDIYGEVYKGAVDEESEKKNYIYKKPDNNAGSSSKKLFNSTR
jgi:hypothetical protein